MRSAGIGGKTDVCDFPRPEIRLDAFRNRLANSARAVAVRPEMLKICSGRRGAICGAKDWRSLFEGNVGVSAAESETVYSGDAALSLRPRLQFTRDCDAGVVERDAWIDFSDVQLCRNLAMLQRQSTTLARPATPEAFSRWPMLALTEPTRQDGSPSPVSPNTALTASTSIGSPMDVPVP